MSETTVGEVQDEIDRLKSEVSTLKNQKEDLYKQIRLLEPQKYAIECEVKDLKKQNADLIGIVSNLSRALGKGQ